MHQKFFVNLYRIANEFISTINHIKVGNDVIGKGIFIIDIIGSNRTITMTDIAEIMKVPASTATRLVDKLVNIGLIVRTKDENINDRRKVNLQLTEFGNELYNRFQKHQELFLQVIGERFNKEEIGVTFKVLEEISNHSDMLFKI